MTARGNARGNTRGGVGLGAALLACAACGSGSDPAGTSTASDAASGPSERPPWFREEARAAGLAFVHRSGHQQAFLTPEILAGGVALLDANEDGALDVYFVQAGAVTAPPEERPPNQLFVNDGAGRFTDVSAGSGSQDRGHGNGVATGDADGDGHIDLYVTNLGPNALLTGRGDATFVDATRAAGVGDAGFGTSAAFVDHDRDGDLDLFVANYLVWSAASERVCFNALGRADYCAPSQYNSPAVDVLYRNDGAGRFTDVTRAAGIDQAFGTGLGVVAGDFSGDGWPDVFVANDGRPNQLWLNQQDGRFEDRGLWLGCAMDGDGKAKAGMGVAIGDIDDDGDLDLLVGNLKGESDSFFRNEDGQFRDARAGSGLAAPSRGSTRFGTAWVDFDADGNFDQYQASGRVATEADPPDPADPFAEPNLLYRGLGGGRFEEFRPRGGTWPVLTHTSRGAAFGDLDGDGAIDVVVVNRDAGPYFLRNVVPARGHWLLVRALDARGSDALGAQLALALPDRTLRRDVRSAYSYCSASDVRVHFGLGGVTRVDTLEVTWPDGLLERFAVGPVDRELTVRRGTGQGR